MTLVREESLLPDLAPALVNELMAINSTQQAQELHQIVDKEDLEISDLGRLSSILNAPTQFIYQCLYREVDFVNIETNPSITMLAYLLKPRIYNQTIEEDLDDPIIERQTTILLALELLGGNTQEQVYSLLSNIAQIDTLKNYTDIGGVSMYDLIRSQQNYTQQEIDLMIGQLIINTLAKRNFAQN